MGRTKDTTTNEEGLSVKIPSFFRCPISLDVMKSPVSLCTGVTYDRSSIQRWLDSGNNTCPATMQPLPCTDLVPNLTLHRLITRWSMSSHSVPTTTTAHQSILQELRSTAPNPSPALLKKLSMFLDSSDADDWCKNQLVGGCADVIGHLARNTKLTQLATRQEAVLLAAKIILAPADCVDQQNKNTLIDAIGSGSGSVRSLIDVVREGDGGVQVRASAVVIINALMAGTETKGIVYDEVKELIPEVIGLIGEEEKAAVDAGLSCLVTLSSAVRRSRIRMVRLGIVPALAHILSSKDGKSSSSSSSSVVCGSSAEKAAMKLMEMASGCSEGREAICENAEETIPAVLGRMMKVGKEGTSEAAVVVLWRVCHLFRDRRAQEAMVAVVNGGLTKILLLMQSDCSAAAREMAGDLLKVFRVNAKCCLGGYDTKTAHIMPF